MRRYDIEIKRIKKKYDAKLHQLYKDNVADVLSFVWLNKINRSNVSKLRKQELIEEAKEFFDLNALSNQEFLKLLLNNSGSVNEILSDFKNEFVDYCKSQNLKLNYVVNKKIEIINPSLYETKYNQNVGNCVMASSEEVSKLAFSMKLLDENLIKVGENILLLSSTNNLEIGNKLKTKQPLFVYKLSIQDFEPVLTVMVNNHIPTILFEDEWVSDKSICVEENDCEELRDITNLVNYFKVFAFKNNQDTKDLSLIRKFSKSTKREAEKALNKLLFSGKVVFINDIIKSNIVELSKN